MSKNKGKDKNAPEIVEVPFVFNPTTADPTKTTKYWNNQTPPTEQELTDGKNKYADPYFQPNDNSIFGREAKGKYTDEKRGKDLEAKLTAAVKAKFLWKRLIEMQDLTLFGDFITPEQVSQGFLGNCYFLSALSSLAVHPELITQLFRTKEYNPNGYYEVVLFIDGEWQIVFVDDSFPFIKENDAFAFANPVNNVVWSMILEKAWAKVNGGYSNTQGGAPGEAIQVLTGFPSELFLTVANPASEMKPTEPKKLFDIILTCSKENEIISCSSIFDQAIEEKGLVAQHGYSFLKAKRYERVGLDIMKLRNPWGQNEYKCEFEGFEEATISKFKKYNDESKDGTFWIDVANYFKYFGCTYISHLFFGAKIKYYYIDVATTDPTLKEIFDGPLVFNMSIKEEAKVNFSIIFNNWRFHRDIDSDTVAHPFFFILAKIKGKNKSIEKIHSKFSITQDITVFENLRPGNYLIWMYSPKEFLKPNEKNYKYTFTIQALVDYEIKYIANDKSFSLLNSIVFDYCKMNILNPNKKGELECDVRTDLIQGFSIILLDNRNHDKFAEGEIKIVPEKQCILGEYRTMKTIPYLIPPLDQKIIISFFNEIGEGKLELTNKFLLVDGEKVTKSENSSVNTKTEFLQFSELSKITDEKVYLSESEFVHLPEKEEIPKELDNTNTKELLFIMYPKEMNMLLDKYRDLNAPDKSKEVWTRIEDRKGIYITVKYDNMEGGIIFQKGTGIKYIGYLSKGVMDKKGELWDKDGIMYEGFYNKGIKQGKGKLRIGKDFYEGDFDHDSFHGRGKYTYANGDSWEGEFVKGKKNGIGIQTYKKQDRKEIICYIRDRVAWNAKMKKGEKISPARKTFRK